MHRTPFRRIAALAAALTAAACGTQPAADRPLDDDVVYVDVRTPEEFATGHVEGAINIPHTEMPQRWHELAEYRDRPLVVYCRTGRRSAAAIRTLRDAGFENLENGRGLRDLARHGVPTTASR